MAIERELVMSSGEMLKDLVPTVAGVSLTEAPANVEFMETRRDHNLARVAIGDVVAVQVAVVDDESKEVQSNEGPSKIMASIWGACKSMKQRLQGDGWEQQACVVQVEDDQMKVQQEVQSSERPSKIHEVKASCSRARLNFQVIYGNDTTAAQLERRKKSWPNYTQKVLGFACTVLLSALNPFSSTPPFTIKILLVVDIILFILINGIHLIKLPNWGNGLACISCFLLELATCLLILPFNGYYAFSILAMMFLIIAIALIQPKLQHTVKKYVLPTFANSDEENDYLNHLFDTSNIIVTCGGLVTMFLGHYSYMVGPVTAAGFFFFSTVLLGLYLMMVIAMRALSPPHAACLAIVLKALLLLTIITASISFVHQSVTTPKVVNFNHRKNLAMF